MDANRLNEHFDIREYVPREVYAEQIRVRGEERGAVFCRRFIDERIVLADTKLKLLLQEHYGEEVGITINNWLWNGPRINSGYRKPGSGVGKDTSLHVLGRASDKVCYLKKSKKNIPVKEIRDLVMGKWHDVFYAIGIRRIEDVDHTPTWFHWDTCFTGESRIIEVEP